MNLFEDLVEELKGENLLEETVIETSESSQPTNPQNSIQTKTDSKTPAIDAADQKNSHASIQDSINDDFPEITDDVMKSESLAAETFKSADLENSTGFEIDDEFAAEAKNNEKQSVNENDFYRRRASEEVSSLKIVEHLLSGVEREHMKIFPKSYDDVAVSIALHDFLKITKDAQSPEHAQAEFKLMQETESWYSSLSYRDKHISVGDLRRYCETSKPPLSSQALVSLARFYRNSPFSEQVRSKFDMVITRLLSRETGNNIREVVFPKDKLIHQLTGLYGDWSSIPLYAADDDSEVLIAVLKFDDFVNEITKAETFEELIKNDFFNRLRIFKESTGENFFSPLLTATAVESNIEIGNSYVYLVTKEGDKTNSSELEEKYKYLLDQVVSDSTSKTLQLVELLKHKDIKEPSPARELIEEKEVIIDKANHQKTVITETPVKTGLFNINKWVIILAICAVVMCAGLYIWSEYLTPQVKPSSSATKVPLENTSLQMFYKTARISKDTFYAITEPAWNDLSKESKEDMLKKTLEMGKEKGFSKVHLINTEGKTVGFASADGIDLTQQP